MYRIPTDNTSFTINFTDDEKEQPRRRFEINWPAVIAYTVGSAPWLLLVIWFAR